MDPQLSKSIQKIEAAYKGLGYSLGWRFLYGVPKTLVKPNGLMWLGLNPGGDTYEPPVSFLDQGNAYLLEAQSWDKDGESLANQIKIFFEELRALPICKSVSAENLLENTLVSNFCPFRSPTWKALPKRKEAIAFSKSLWRDIFHQVKPHLVLCMGKETYFYLSQLASERGFLDQVNPEKHHPAGWGRLSFHIKQFRYPNRKLCLMVYLPHLSRYKLMSNSKCRRQVVSLIRRLKAIYEGS